MGSRSSRVVPEPIEGPDASIQGAEGHEEHELHLGRCDRLVHALRSLFKLAWTTWGSLQLCHQGKYSIERLMAMDNYYRTTSVLRMLLVCIMTPLPALVISILIELIPLQSPHAGAFANWGFWIRNWVTLFIMIMAMTTQVKVIIPELPFTTAKCLIISAMATSIYISIGILIGGYIVFPIPFMSVLGGVPGVAIACATVLLVLRIRPSTMDPAQRTQLARFFRICFSSGLLLITYPAYNVAFVASNTTAQGLLIVALQVMKIGAKNVTAKALAHLEDYLPEYVVFLVEVFNALYLTSCMQNSNSMYMIILITVMDYGQSLWELYTIKTRANTMHQLFEACWKRNPSASNFDFLAFAIYICRKADKINRKEAKQINLRACLKHSVSVEHAALLNRLEAQKLFSKGGRERRQSLVSPSSQAVVITPFSSTSNGRKRSSFMDMRPSSREGVRKGSILDSFATATGVLTYIQAFKSLSLKDQHSTKLLLETLHSLFHIECLVLVEYVECIVPFIYFIYSAARSQLPSNEYYPNRRHIPEGSFDRKLLGNVALYTGLSFLSFVILNVLYWWKFRFLPLYQLAFVLENQLELVQSKLVLWIIFLLQFELYHYGADFTFRFTWLENK
ncbi:hypothetical protein Gpo141_00000466 [Globisporangium polare]